MKALKFAASLAALSLAPFAAQAAECFDRDTDDPKAGNATAVVGPAVDVERQNRDGAFRPASGADMFTGDTVRTGDESHLQLKLCDWSTYTFSPNSESAISEFFDARGAGRRRVVNFFRGGFRFSSGRDTEPGSTEVEIQESGVTMGVRGTNVILVELDGFVYALLEGPVRDNTGLTPKGLVEFWTDDNRDAIEATLKRPGFALRIGPEDRISEPFRADANLLRRIYQAFVPVVPESDGGALEYAGNALGDSGQGAQEGETYQQEAENRNNDEDEQTEQRPEEEEPQMPPPMMVPVGDILPLDALEDFAGMQQGTDGHILALASAQLFQDDGSGPVQVDDGLTIVQIEIDWATRTIAPTALASFVQFDLLSDPNDLSVFDPTPFQLPQEFFDAYGDAILNSVGIPFGSGGNNLAVFDAPLFTFTIRQGAGDTVTVDVDVDFSANDGQGGTLNLVSTLQDLMVNPGPGELVLGVLNFAQTASIAELEAEGASRNQVITMTGNSTVFSNIFDASDPSTQLPGVQYAQIEVNFGNRTIGGNNSFLAVTVAPIPAFGNVQIFEYIPFDQPVSFDIGLFGESLFPLPRLTSDPVLTHGQTSLLVNNGLVLGALNTLLDLGGNDRLYTSGSVTEFDGDVSPLSTITALEGLAGTLGAGTFFYDSARALNASSFFSDGMNGAGGDAEMQIDINFANRTLGGGGSYIAVSIDNSSLGIDVQFTELINAVSFDDAADGMGAFAFDGADFSGQNMDSMLLLIRDGVNGPGETADAYFSFTDGGTGDGGGLITGMPLGQGSSSPP